MDEAIKALETQWAEAKEAMDNAQEHLEYCREEEAKMANAIEEKKTIMRAIEAVIEQLDKEKRGVEDE